MTVPTRQEMFNRAWLGLKEQGFERCVDKLGHCVYTGERRGDVQYRCAWGHVDPDGTEGLEGSVEDLAVDGAGLAARLDQSGMMFAMALQAAHDLETRGPSQLPPLEVRLRDFARAYKLEVPGG